jgi:hypothetical protein
VRNVCTSEVPADDEPLYLQNIADATKARPSHRQCGRMAGCVCLPICYNYWTPAPLLSVRVVRLIRVAACGAVAPRRTSTKIRCSMSLVRALGPLSLPSSGLPPSTAPGACSAAGERLETSRLTRPSALASSCTAADATRFGSNGTAQEHFRIWKTAPALLLRIGTKGAWCEQIL